MSKKIVALSVISSPNIAGSACNYSDNGFDLDPGAMGVNGALALPASGINEANTEIENQVYPNPAAIEFSIDLSSKDAMVVNMIIVEE